MAESVGGQVEIGGHVEPGFEPVAEAFAQNFAERGELGAAFAATLDGSPVVDLWGGVADGDSGSPWRQDTMQVIFSGTKGLTALCVAMLIDRGRLALEDPVSRHWPEFAAQGKEAVTVAEIVSHRGRLPGVRAQVSEQDILDPRKMADLLAAQEQESDPRTEVIYHPITYGWLCGELVRRVDGRSIGRFFAEEVAAPLGLEAWIGLPADQEPRVARCNTPRIGERARPAARTRFPAMHCGPASGRTRPCWGRPARLSGTRRRCMPPRCPAQTRSAPHARSRGSTARLRAAASSTACGCSPRDAGAGPDATFQRSRIVHRTSSWPLASASCCSPRMLPFGPVEVAFGHNGAGGSCHGAWPKQRVGFSYAMNEMRDDPEGDDRVNALLGASASHASRSTVSLRELIDATAWVDTHEHLVEERRRLGDEGYAFSEVTGQRVAIPADWTGAARRLLDLRLVCAGLSESGVQRLLGSDLSPLEKWDVAEELFEAARCTGYLRAVDLSTERLCGSGFPGDM